MGKKNKKNKQAHLIVATSTINDSPDTDTTNQVEMAPTPVILVETVVFRTYLPHPQTFSRRRIKMETGQRKGIELNKFLRK